VGLFDVSIVFGLLYHLENPVAVLRAVRAITGRVCLVETQVAPELSGFLDWGSWRYRKEMLGSFALVDESSDNHHGNSESNVGEISLVPSCRALVHIIRSYACRAGDRRDQEGPTL
jgi:tRNA (mo5U34)-methyltransferase